LRWRAGARLFARDDLTIGIKRIGQGLGDTVSYGRVGQLPYPVERIGGGEVGVKVSCNRKGIGRKNGGLLPKFTLKSVFVQWL
jgi:hypothetical protein